MNGKESALRKKMNAETHNRNLGIFHLIHGGLYSLMVLGMTFFFGFFSQLPRGGRGRSEPFGDGFFLFFMAMMLFYWVVLTIPSLVAGYGLLKKKSWGRMWGIIAGVTSGMMSFPLGMALCVYSVWFLFSEEGKRFHENLEQRFDGQPQGVLHGAPQPAGWSAHHHEREREYTYAPPHEPPNWRGE
ncbi:MAG: hypothetical protein H7Y30_05695 [Pyrinomonadaceae bacterium]|nr:hypothetical protein [Pyrinomonadaceae bacterium]